MTTSQRKIRTLLFVSVLLVGVSAVAAPALGPLAVLGWIASVCCGIAALLLVVLLRRK